MKKSRKLSSNFGNDSRTVASRDTQEGSINEKMTLYEHEVTVLTVEHNWFYLPSFTLSK